MEYSGFEARQAAQCPWRYAKKGPEIPEERANLYAAQAGAPSVYQEPHLWCRDQCSVAADLADMQCFAKQYNGMRYLMTVIAIFSKFAWAIPAHSKDAKAITTAVAQVLTTANPRQPQCLQKDNGKEFLHLDFQALKKRYGIQHFASKSEQKAAVVERFNRTIKIRIWTYFRTAAPCA